MVADSLPDIVVPTPLWMELGTAPSPVYVVPAEHARKPAVVVTIGILEDLSKLPQKEKLPLPPGVEAGSFADTSYTPEEYMLAAGVEEAHHAIIARYRGLKYGIALGATSPDQQGVYLAQEVEWQAGRFVLEALRIQGASSEAIAAHQRRLNAAEEIRKLVGLENFGRIPYLNEFVTYHDKNQ